MDRLRSHCGFEGFVFFREVSEKIPKILNKSCMYVFEHWELELSNDCIPMWGCSLGFWSNGSDLSRCGKSSQCSRRETDMDGGSFTDCMFPLPGRFDSGMMKGQRSHPERSQK